MYKFPFNKKATMHILGTTGTYPHNDNCYDVEVLEPGKTWRCNFAPKAEVELGMVLQTMLTQEQLDSVFPLLGKLRDSGYQEASDNAAMDAAGESL